MKIFPWPEPRRVMREDIEWCDVWLPHLNEHELPRVLLIGDSITRAYSKDVEAILKGRAYVGLLATSRSVGDSVLVREIETVLSEAEFDLIHFNNGMHGWGYTEEEYEKYFPEFAGSVRHFAPEARLIWASTTPVRVAGWLEKFDARTERVRRRNAIAADFARRNEILVNDLYSLAQIEHVSEDGVHFNAEGSAALARQVAKAIEEHLSLVSRK